MNHYIIDLVTGILVAHYIYLLVDEYICIIDNSIIGMKNTDKKEVSSFGQILRPLRKPSVGPFSAWCKRFVGGVIYSLG